MITCLHHNQCLAIRGGTCDFLVARIEWTAKGAILNALPYVYRGLTFRGEIIRPGTLVLK
jgi:hypothetical protein